MVPAIFWFDSSIWKITGISSLLIALISLRMVAALRERIADDLDSPGAIAVVDDWVAGAAGGQAPGSAPLIRAAVDALLGIAL